MTRGSSGSESRDDTTDAQHAGNAELGNDRTEIDAVEETATPDDPAPHGPTTDDPAPDDLASADPTPDPPEHPIPENRGEVLFYEPGGSWWVVAIGPILIGAVLAMEIAGPGQVHWPVIGFFGLIIVGFSIVQVVAARRHVTVELTEQTLQQGTRIISLAAIDTIYPENNGPEPREWESARALGELHGVPRRRRGIGVKLANGALAQAWARDVQRFRRELTEAHTAVQLGLPPRGTGRGTEDS